MTQSAPDLNAHPQDMPLFETKNPMAERKTRWALILTAIMMVIEIIAGWQFQSMALLADGWHMSSHVLALGLALAAYIAARHLANDPRFNFGTWKIEVLAGYSSALFLLGIAALMVYESIARMITPTAIAYNEAIVVAIVGLLINVACAWILKDDHDHSHSHGHHHGHDHHDHAADDHSSDHAADDDAHQDLNLRAAYVHVLADAATSVLAIIALVAAKYAGVLWLDPVMGIVGAVLVTIWAIGLMKETGRVLIDAERNAPVAAEIYEVMAEHFPAVIVQDLRLWRVGKGQYACLLILHSDQPLTPAQVKQQLRIHEELVHNTVEVNDSDAVLASSASGD